MEEGEMSYEGLCGIRLIAHPVGRKAMIGWLVQTPGGEAVIKRVDEPDTSGRAEVFVEFTSGENKGKTATFNAKVLMLL